VATLWVREIKMPYLLVIPTEFELAAFLKACSNIGLEHQKINLGRLAVAKLPQLELVIAAGGLGKTQFGIQTQYCIDKLEGLTAVFCIGASGALLPNVAIGDVVVGTETVEHDIKKFSRPLIPRFPSDLSIVNQIKDMEKNKRGFSVHFGPIASGDEDVFTLERKKAIQLHTAALAVAWEGAGGARACNFSKKPFVEIRGVTDSAEQSAPEEFFANFEISMGNLTKFMIEWATHTPGIQQDNQEI
jgi:adenosylhomocysteine nucleosidase